MPRWHVTQALLCNWMRSGCSSGTQETRTCPHYSEPWPLSCQQVCAEGHKKKKSKFPISQCWQIMPIWKPCKLNMSPLCLLPMDLVAGLHNSQMHKPCLQPHAWVHQVHICWKQISQVDHSQGLGRRKHYPLWDWALQTNSDAISSCCLLSYDSLQLCGTGSIAAGKGCQRNWRDNTVGGT